MRMPSLSPLSSLDFKYWLLISFLRLMFFVMCRMLVLVYRSLNSVSSASSGVGMISRKHISSTDDEPLVMIAKILLP